MRMTTQKKKKKIERLERKGNKLVYGTNFELDLDRFAEVISVMKPIYDKNELLYKSAHLFPEFKFEKYFYRETKKNHLAQMLFLSAYFDHNKWSEQHYGRDMMRMNAMVESNTLFSYIKKELDREKHKPLQTEINFEGVNNIQQSLHIKHPILTEGKKSKQKTLLAKLYKLPAQEQILFMKKVARTIALDEETYLLKELDNDAVNNPLHYFRGMLEKVVHEYEGNPLYIAKDRTPKEFATELKTFPGIGPGLAYLTVLFYAHGGLVPYSANELEGVDPKIDGNDIYVAQITDILKVYNKTSKTSIINALTWGMHETAKNLAITSVEVDLCFWVAAQAYKFKFPSTKSTATPFFTPLEYQQFSSAYYSEGNILPNYTYEGEQIEIKTGKKANSRIIQPNLFDE